MGGAGSLANYEKDYIVNELRFPRDQFEYP